jgi:RHS repeat-associated protein
MAQHRVLLATAAMAGMLVSVAVEVRGAAPAAATTSTLVQAGAGNTVAANVVTSPHGTWQALLVSPSSGPTVLRSTDGSTWQSIGVPVDRVGHIAISDSGEVYAVANDTSTPYYQATDFWKYTTSWSSMVVYDTFESYLYAGPVAIVTDGTTLVGIASSGRTFYSTDDGATWSQGGNSGTPGGHGSVEVIGGYIQVLGNTGTGELNYARWSIAAKAAAPVTTPPAGPQYNWSPRLFSTSGTPSDLWIAVNANGGGLTLHHSADSGANWSTVVSSDLYPTSIPSPGGFSMGSDNRIHIYGTSATGTSTKVYEISRGLTAASDWSPTQLIATLPASGPLAAVWAPQRGDGVQDAPISVWASVPVGGGCCQYDDYTLQGQGDAVQVAGPTVRTAQGALVDPGAGRVEGRVFTSPTGTWRALNDAGAILRSSDGVHWQDIGVPASGYVPSIAIADTGEVYAVTRNNPQGYYNATDFWRYKAGGWQGPATYDNFSSQLFGGPGVILTDGHTLIGVSGSHVFSSTDDGNTWVQRGDMTLPPQPRLTLIGDYIHILGGQSSNPLYYRWSVATGAMAAVATPPGASWAAVLVSANGSTTDLWIASKPTSTTLSLWHSTDAGNTWSAAVAGETLPGALAPQGWFSMGSDGRLHAYGSTWAGGRRTLLEASRGLGPSADWSPVTTLGTYPDPGQYPPSAWVTQQVNGVQPGTVNLWFASNPTTSYGYDDDYWVLRNGPPLGGPLTAGEVYNGGHNPAEACLPCVINNVTYYPVSPSTGDFWHSFDDLSVPGRGMPLHFAHSYDSLAAGVNGPLGYGWTEPYNMRLEISPGSAAVTVDQENGAQVTFTLSGTSYTAPPRVQATLAHNGDGTWTFTRRAQEVFAFDAAGLLTAERDLNGTTTTVTRPNPSTTVVTDPAGRTLTMALDGSGRITSVTDTASPPRVVHFAYDAAGDLTDATDIGGGVTHFTYDGSHRLLTMLDPAQAGVAGATPVVNHYDAQGRVDWQSDFMGRTTSFDYISVPGSTKVTDPMGNATLFTYTYGLLTSETRGYGTAKAATWTYAYEPWTLGVASITDPLGNVSTRSYDPQGNLIASTDPLGRPATASFNALNEPTSTTDARGVTTTYTYDAAGNLTRRSTPWAEGPPNAVQAVVYHHDDAAHPGDVTSVTDPLAKTTVLSYDAYGDPAGATDPLGNRSQSCHDSVGRPRAAITPKGTAAGATCASPAPAPFTTYVTTNAFGDVLTQTDPLGHQTVRTYDADGRLKTLRDADGNTTSYDYDKDGEPTLVTRADATTLAYGYDAGGNRITTRDGANHTTTYGYADPAFPSAPTSVSDPLGRVTAYDYDRAGRRISKQDPGGDCAATPRTGCTSYGYDAAGQLISIDYSDPATPDVTAVAYDAAGHRTSMTDGTGTAAWAWDSLGRLTSNTNGAGKTVGYTYDLRNAVKTIAYPASTGTVTRTYDDAGRLTTVTDWLSHTTTFGYDADSVLRSEAYPNGTTATFTPDGADRLTSISHAPTATPASPFASFAYGLDDADQVASVSSTGVPADNHAYSYTGLNQLQDVDGASTRYGYDAADNPTLLASGGTQAFDAAGELVSSTAVTLVGTGTGGGTSASTAVALSAATAAGDQVYVAVAASTADTVTTPTGYAVVGTFTSGTVGAKTILYRHAAAAGESGVTVSGPLPFAKSVVAAVYRGVDPVTPNDPPTSGPAPGATQVTAPTNTASQPGGRLLFVGGAGQNVTAGAWTPPAGMAQAAAKSDQAQTSALVADQALPAAGATGSRSATFTPSLGTANLVGVLVPVRPAATSFGYDQRGNRTSVAPPTGPAVALGYDQANRLVGYGPSAAYAYDGDGLRMSKTVSGVLTRFTWDASGGVPLVLDDGANKYVYGPRGAPVEQVGSGGVVTYLHQDQLGSTRVLTNSSGTVVGTATYDAYGRPVGSTGTASSPLGWAGEYRDAESGLVYLRARYYDPSTAQFLSRDPIEALTHEPYSYASNSPLNATDPLGLITWHQVAAVSAAVAVGITVGVAVVAAAPLEAAVIVGGAAVIVGAELAIMAGAVAGSLAAFSTYVGLEAINSCIQEARRHDDLPAQGEPGSTSVRDDGKGNGQIRDYGPDGRAITDYDFGHDHTGDGDPHAHDWDWTQPRPRGAPRPLRPGE